MVEPGRPLADEYLDYFETYISLVPESDILNQLDSQTSDMSAMRAAVPADQEQVLHAPYTWTIKQVVGHCIDTERVFAYRAARFAAGDKTSLPGFDQDTFVANTDYNACELGSLVDELVETRKSNLSLFRRQNNESWMRGGSADGKKMTVRAAAYVMVGHIRYHWAIVRKRLSGATQ
ncbi:MAG: DinB family protein [Planctomycetota bacterium]